MVLYPLASSQCEASRPSEAIYGEDRRRSQSLDEVMRREDGSRNSHGRGGEFE